MLRIGLRVMHLVNTNHSLTMLASISVPPIVPVVIGASIAATSCWIAYHVAVRRGLGFRHRRLDLLGHRLHLKRTRWRVESTAAIADGDPPLVAVQFQQSGSRVVATGEETDGRRRWFEGYITGNRLALCEVSRVRRGFHVATLLLRMDETTGCLTGTRQVLQPDGSLELQQLTLVPWKDGAGRDDTEPPLDDESRAFICGTSQPSHLTQVS